MANILLDRRGDARPPDGYQLVENEVDFLLLAGQGRALLIRGERLCAWAEVFYRARALPYEETRSIKNEIQALCPELTDEHLQELVDGLGDNLARLNSPLTIRGILETLYPAAIWKAPLSLHHAAHWLLWVWRRRWATKRRQSARR